MFLSYLTNCEELNFMLQCSLSNNDMICLSLGEYIYEHPVSDDHWKKDEILAAKIKKFLSVS